MTLEWPEGSDENTLCLQREPCPTAAGLPSAERTARARPRVLGNHSCVAAMCVLAFMMGTAWHVDGLGDRMLLVFVEESDWSHCATGLCNYRLVPELQVDCRDAKTPFRLGLSTVRAQGRKAESTQLCKGVLLSFTLPG